MLKNKGFLIHLLPLYVEHVGCPQLSSSITGWFNTIINC